MTTNTKPKTVGATTPRGVLGMTTKSKNKTDAWMPLWIGAYLAAHQYLKSQP